MLALIKRVWHDPVGSQVITAAILFGASRLVHYWPPHLLTSVNRWFDTPITITVTRGDLVNWPLLLASMGVSLSAVVVGIRKLRKRWAPPPDEPRADAQPPDVEDTKAPATFEPEKFELTPPRCRALLVLLERVDCRNPLHELYQFVIKVGPFVDKETSKGQLQYDMEEAERLGLVSIDRVGALTQYYSLTAPNGRDWVLHNKAKLQARARMGMERRDMRSPYG